MTAPRLPLSMRHPAAYALAVRLHQLRRATTWWLDGLGGKRMARVQTLEPLPVRIKHHEARLLRPLGDSDMWLQHNKVKNLAIALRTLDGLVIGPGETFSFWQRVGRPTVERGYVLGMEISRGKARSGVGGGLLRATNRAAQWQREGPGRSPVGLPALAVRMLGVGGGAVVVERAVAVLAGSAHAAPPISGAVSGSSGAGLASNRTGSSSCVDLARARRRIPARMAPVAMKYVPPALAVVTETSVARRPTPRRSTPESTEGLRDDIGAMPSRGILLSTTKTHYASASERTFRRCAASFSPGVDDQPPALEFLVPMDGAGVALGIYACTDIGR